MTSDFQIRIVSWLREFDISESMKFLDLKWIFVSHFEVPLVTMFHEISFNRKFNLADHVKVTAATMQDGLLKINLQREIPEEAKPKTHIRKSGLDY